MLNRQKKTTKLRIFRSSFISVGSLIAVILFLTVSNALHLFAHEFDNPLFPLGAILFLFSLFIAYTFAYNQKNKFIENALLVVGLSVLVAFISLSMTVGLTIAIHGLY